MQNSLLLLLQTIKKDVPGPGFTSLDTLPTTDSNPYFVSTASSTGASDQPVITGPGASSVTGTHLDSFSHQDPILSDADVDPSHDQSDRDSGEEGELSDSEVTEKNEEMNYRETVRAVRAFFGWTYIPDLGRLLETLTISLISHGRVSIPGEPVKFPLSYPPTIGFATRWRNLTPEQRKAIHHALRRRRDSRLANLSGLPRVSPSGMLS